MVLLDRNAFFMPETVLSPRRSAIIAQKCSVSVGEVSISLDLHCSYQLNIHVYLYLWLLQLYTFIGG